MSLTKEQRKEIIAFLMPVFDDKDSRSALVKNALYDSPFLHRIKWDGDTFLFSTHLVTLLENYGGKGAIQELLQGLQDEFGYDKKALLKILIKKLNEEPKSQNTLSQAQQLKPISETEAIKRKNTPHPIGKPTYQKNIVLESLNSVIGSRSTPKKELVTDPVRRRIATIIVLIIVSGVLFKLYTQFTSMPNVVFAYDENSFQIENIGNRRINIQKASYRGFNSDGVSVTRVYSFTTPWLEVGECMPIRIAGRTPTLPNDCDGFYVEVPASEDENYWTASDVDSFVVYWNNQQIARCLVPDYTKRIGRCEVHVGD